MGKERKYLFYPFGITLLKTAKLSQNTLCDISLLENYVKRNIYIYLFVPCICLEICVGLDRRRKQEP